MRISRSALTSRPRTIVEYLGYNITGGASAFQLDDVESPLIIDSEQIDAPIGLRGYLTPQQHERPETKDCQVIGDDRLETLLLIDSFHDQRPWPVLFYPPQVHLNRHGSNPTVTAPADVAPTSQATTVR